MIVLSVASASLAGRHADGGADDRVLGHRVGRRVGVADRADVELVDVVDIDGERLVGEANRRCWWPGP